MYNSHLQIIVCSGERVRLRWTSISIYLYYIGNELSQNHLKLKKETSQALTQCDTNLSFSLPAGPYCACIANPSQGTFNTGNKCMTTELFPLHHLMIYIYWLHAFLLSLFSFLQENWKICCFCFGDHHMTKFSNFKLSIESHKSTVNPAHEVNSIKQPLVLKGHLFITCRRKFDMNQTCFKRSPVI